MGVLIDTERKGCESAIHDHDSDLCVTMVGWIDVPYSDWGDFRRRGAIDITSLKLTFTDHPRLTAPPKVPPWVVRWTTHDFYLFTHHIHTAALKETTFIYGKNFVFTLGRNLLSGPLF